MHDSFSTLLGQIAGEFTDRERRGERPSIDEYLTRYPEVADLLRDVLPMLVAVQAPEKMAIDAPPSPLRDHLPPRPELPGYEVLGELGRGGMGVVYKARQKALGRLVAVKMILAGGTGEESVRLKGEAEAIARLQHPGIVQVFEVGEWEGRPYISLEYCPGGSLAEALGGTPLPGNEAARLVMRLAEATQVAHDAGVVHRDLKPANVLLVRGDASGSQLEEGGRLVTRAVPKITDFGLARKLDAPGLTQSGAVVGTPSYMAPEQASGGKAGPPADVWALGAILYECLTGRPPFRAASVFDTLVQVMQEEPAAPRQLNVQAPRDLETIALKCLQKDPARRYPRAADLATDLGRFLDRRPILARPVGSAERAVKWARRRPGVASLLATLGVVIVAALIVTSSLYARATGQATLAREQRDLAESNLGLARQAVDRCFLVARDDPRLQGDGMRQVRHLLYEAALPFYRDFTRLRPDDPELREELAGQRFQVGSILFEIRSPAEAARELTDAVAEYEALLEVEPGSITYRRKLASALQNLGNAKTVLGQADEALAAYQRARDILSNLRLEEPASASVAGDLASTCTSVGAQQARRGQLREALACYEEAASLYGRLTGIGSSQLRAQTLQVRLFNNMGLLQRELGKHAEGVKTLERACALGRVVVKLTPGVGDNVEALTLPLISLGDAQMAAGDLTAALKSQEEAAGLLRGLVAAYPAVTSYQTHLGMALHNAGSAHDDLGQRREALALLEEALELRRRLVEGHGGLLQHRLDLGKNFAALAEVQAKVERRQDAAANYLQAIRVLTRLAADHPKAVEAQLALSGRWYNLGSILGNWGEKGAGLAAYVKARDLLRSFVARHPAVVQGRVDLANTLCNLAIAQNDLRRSDEAVESCTEAVGIQRMLLAEQKHSRRLRELLITLYNRGDSLAVSERPQAALHDLDESLRLLEQLGQVPGQGGTVRTGTRLIRGRRAGILAELGRHADAAADLAAVATVVDAGARGRVLLDQAKQLELAGRGVEAIEVATRATSRKEAAPGDQHRAAALFARWSAKAAGDPAVPLAVREKDAEGLARLAMTSLRRAAAGGVYTGAEFLRELDSIEDFATLRQREDYAAFRKRLTK